MIFSLTSSISVSQDGTLCLWDVSDGLCIKSAENLLTSFAPTSMASIGNNRHVVVSGHSHQATIIDVPRMTVSKVYFLFSTLTNTHRSNYKLLTITTG